MDRLEYVAYAGPHLRSLTEITISVTNVMPHTLMLERRSKVIAVQTTFERLSLLASEEFLALDFMESTLP
jgi:hypothetical protein